MILDLRTRMVSAAAGLAMLATPAMVTGEARATPPPTASAQGCAGYFVALPGEGRTREVRGLYANFAFGARPRPARVTVATPDRRLTPELLRGLRRKRLGSPYFHGWRTSVTRTVQLIERRARRCPTEPIAVGGFAQGAIVARKSLLTLAADGQDTILDRVVGVWLGRDPMAHPEPGVGGLHGILGDGAPNLPAAVTDRALRVVKSTCYRYAKDHYDRICQGSGPLTARQVRGTIASAASYTGAYDATFWGGTLTARRPSEYVVAGRAFQFESGFNSSLAAPKFDYQPLHVPTGLSVALDPYNSGGALISGTLAVPGRAVVTFTRELPALSSAVQGRVRIVVHVEPSSVAKPGLTLVTQGIDGRPADGHSYHPLMSRHGSVVTFSSNADNLIPGVTGRPRQQTYARTADGSVVLLSRDAQGRPARGGLGSVPVSISPDGHRVLIFSSARNLAVSHASGYRGHYYLVDVATGRITPDAGRHGAPPWQGRYVVRRQRSAGKRVMSYRLWDRNTHRFVGRPCRLHVRKGYAVSDHSTIAANGSAFATAAYWAGGDEYGRVNRVLLCRTHHGRGRVYRGWFNAAISGDGRYAIMSAGADRYGHPSFSGDPGPQRHLVQQVRLSDDHVRTPFSSPPLVWGYQDEDGDDTYSWGGLAVAASKHGAVSVFASEDVNLVSTAIARPSEIYLWRPRG